MFVPSTEALLMGAVVALYLYDSVVLLHCNEALLYPVGRSGWALRFGSHRFQWRGREVFLPNPLTPHRPLYRVLWSYGASSDVQCTVSEWRRGDRGLAVSIWAMALALWLLLPLGLFSRWGDVSILAALIVFYAFALLALASLWRRRVALSLARGPLLRLAFESLTCPPFALNLIRHVSLLASPHAGLVDAARGLQDAEAWVGTRAVLMARLQDDLRWLEPLDPEIKVVEAELRRLESMSASGHNSTQEGKESV